MPLSGARSPRAMGHVLSVGAARPVARACCAGQVRIDLLAAIVAPFARVRWVRSCAAAASLANFPNQWRDDATNAAALRMSHRCVARVLSTTANRSTIWLTSIGLVLPVGEAGFMKQPVLLPVPKLRPEMLAEGGNDHDVKELRRQGFETIRRGAYVDGAEWQRIDAESRHRLLVTTTMPKLSTEAAVSHISAAVMHGFPFPGAPPSLVHVTRDQQSGGFKRGHLHAHAAPLSETAIVTVDGIPVTDATRTVIDCARSLDLESAICIADNALRRNLTSVEELRTMAATMGPRQGIGRVPRVLELADARSESPGESCSRVAFWRAKLPAPTLQFEVRSDGLLIGRSDFGWIDRRTLGEFDGAIKYNGLVGEDESLREILRRERKREQALIELGWEIVRWGWAELRDPVRLAAKIVAAFRRAERFL